jgi:hypothetical protein
MSITKTLLAGVAGTVLVGSGALASEPVQLSDTQMDNVTAGFVISQSFISDIIGFTLLGTVQTSGLVTTEAVEEIIVNPTPPIFSLREEGSAFASLQASFTGAGGVSSPFGVGAFTTNFPN